MAPLPAIFALWDARVHISLSNCGNKAANVEAAIELLCEFQMLI